MALVHHHRQNNQLVGQLPVYGPVGGSYMYLRLLLSKRQALKASTSKALYLYAWDERSLFTSRKEISLFPSLPLSFSLSLAQYLSGGVCALVLCP